MSDLQELYRSVILDHSRRPVGRGDTRGYAISHHEYNPTCGDELTVALVVGGGRLEQIVWEGQGCAISMASASMMTDLLTGEDAETARGLIDDFRAMMRSPGTEPPDRLGDAGALSGTAKYVMRVKCAMLGWVAVEACLLQAAA